jgi:hypothetical protein
MAIDTTWTIENISVNDGFIFRTLNRHVYRTKLTIDNTKIDDDLVNFPIVIISTQMKMPFAQKFEFSRLQNSIFWPPIFFLLILCRS